MTQNLALGSSFPAAASGHPGLWAFNNQALSYYQDEGEDCQKYYTGDHLKQQYVHWGFVSGVVCSAAGNSTTRVPKDIMLGCHVCTTLFRNGCRGEGTIIIKLKSKQNNPHCTADCCYVKCEDAIRLGDRKHHVTLQVGWNENDTVVLDFEDDFPHVSTRSESVKIEGWCRFFELNIKGRKKTFKLAQSATTSALPSASRAEAPVPSETSEDPRPPASIRGVQILSSHDIVCGCELSPSDVQRADLEQVRLKAAAEPSVELGQSGGAVVGFDLQSSSMSIQKEPAFADADSNTGEDIRTSSRASHLEKQGQVHSSHAVVSILPE